MTDHALLDIQHLDTEAEQLRHRRVALPARTALTDAQAEQAKVRAEIEGIGVSRVEVSTRQKRLEDEAQVFSNKADEDDARLYGGDVGVKDLEALQEEIKGLRARQADIEDRVLEAMEEGEALAGRLAECEAQVEGLAAQITTIEAEIAASEDEIDGELARVASERAAAEAVVSAEDLAQYERLRPGMGVATVVRFDGGNCVGCPSTMPAMELDRMKHEPPGSTLNCNECGRIVLT
ncbi:MAG: hypothetical protein DHS20C19_15150 [Acidimicrobiales bacterium]|nr:MAG: hypothetical protein DHS20C19_15150 [Acidimicrobiales bacterium]